MAREQLQLKRLKTVRFCLAKALLVAKFSAHEDTQLAIQAAIERVESDLKAVRAEGA